MLIMCNYLYSYINTKFIMVNIAVIYLNVFNSY